MIDFRNYKELMASLKDEAVCRAHMEEMRWGGNPVCPHCGAAKPYKLKNGKTYRCKDKTCKRDFTVTVGTIFENSKIPLSTWIAATYVRNIAILSDGYSDYLVFKKFISVLLNKHEEEEITDKNFLNLEFLNITNSIVKYLQAVSKTNNYSFETDEAKGLIDSLIGVYYGCYSRCNREFDISNKSIIIISTDAERLLLSRQNYFNQWANNIKGILYYSIEQFYERMVSQGYNYEYLPYYIPLVPFPSSEIIVASCMYDFGQDNMREHKPTPSLKQKVYQSDNIPHAINSGNLYKVLDEYITDNAIQNIYKEIPEARMLIHSLTS